MDLTEVLKEIEKERFRKQGEFSDKHARDVANARERAEKEIRRVREQTEEQVAVLDENYKQEQADANERQSRIGARVILNQLSQDYHVIQERSGMLETYENGREDVDAKLELAIKAKTLVEKAKILAEVTQLTDVKGEEPRDVFSYVSYDDKERRCYLLIPTIYGKDNKKVAKGLEDKVMDILAKEEITLGYKGVTSEDGTTHVQVSKMSFSSECDEWVKEINGFSLFTLTTYEDARHLSENLATTLEKLQPHEFEKSALIHKVLQVEFPVIEYFASHSISEINKEMREPKGYISYKKAASMLGKQERMVKQLVTKGKLNGRDEYVTLESVEAYANKMGIEIAGLEKERATEQERAVTTKGFKSHEDAVREKLAQYGEILNNKECAKVLGISSFAGIRHHLKEMESVQDEKGYWRTPKTGILKFLETHYHAGKRWQKKREAHTQEQLSQMQKDAYSRLNGYGDMLTPSELGDVLYMDRRPAARYADLLQAQRGMGEKGQTIYLFSKQNVTAFLNTHCLTTKGWEEKR